MKGNHCLHIAYPCGLYWQLYLLGGTIANYHYAEPENSLQILPYGRVNSRQETTVFSQSVSKKGTSYGGQGNPSLIGSSRARDETLKAKDELLTPNITGTKLVAGKWKNKTTRTKINRGSTRFSGVVNSERKQNNGEVILGFTGSNGFARKTNNPINRETIPRNRGSIRFSGVIPGSTRRLDSTSRTRSKMITEGSGQKLDNMQITPVPTGSSGIVGAKMSLSRQRIPGRVPNRVITGQKQRFINGQVMPFPKTSIGSTFEGGVQSPVNTHRPPGLSGVREPVKVETKPLRSQMASALADSSKLLTQGGQSLVIGQVTSDSTKYRTNAGREQSVHNGQATLLNRSGRPISEQQKPLGKQVMPANIRGTKKRINKQITLDATGAEVSTDSSGDIIGGQRQENRQIISFTTGPRSVIGERGNGIYQRNIRLNANADPITSLAAAIPRGGIPGREYPILSSIPNTDFTCSGQINGYYADTSPEARCQVYHICQNGNMNSFLCPNGTIYNQQYFVCDWWYNVDCNSASIFFGRNAEIGNANSKSIVNDNIFGIPSASQKSFSSPREVTGNTLSSATKRPSVLYNRGNSDTQKYDYITTRPEERKNVLPSRTFTVRGSIKNRDSSKKNNEGNQNDRRKTPIIERGYTNSGSEYAALNNRNTGGSPDNRNRVGNIKTSYYYAIKEKDSELLVPLEKLIIL
ncbi:hypothetical protein SK128_019856 [Halocaridina rubra]|uniref:Chitin-binding type-2 domain-containing protein n=1 Tax=Halocaridina rubra TaxID=373956 RepID=A0AAN8W8F4_HALRR